MKFGIQIQTEKIW